MQIILVFGPVTSGLANRLVIAIHQDLSTGTCGMHAIGQPAVHLYKYCGWSVDLEPGRRKQAGTVIDGEV